MPVKNISVGYSVESSRNDQKVEVLFEPDGESVALKYCKWVEGLGWCCHKTIKLESDQLDELHLALTVARHRVRRKRSDKGEVKTSARVIQLPTIA